jgi:hypothetical protein
MGVQMRKTLLTVIVLLAAISASEASAQSGMYRKKKYFGAIPMNGASLFIGFLDGPDHKYLTEHLSNWAIQRGGNESWENWSTSFYTRLGYQRQVSPNHFLITNLNFAYLKAEGKGEFFTMTDPIVYLTTERTLTTYLFSLDVGFHYYMIKPSVQKIAPYIGGGFSLVVPHERLKSDFKEADGTPYSNPAESINETSLEPGIFGQFGITYYISNRWGTALDGRYQVSQSKFRIHGGNFDISYSGLCLTLGLHYYF